MTKKKNPEDLLKQGRKERIGKQERELIKQAIAMGCKNTEAIAFANIKGKPIEESVFYRYLQRHPDFASELEYLRKNPVLKARGTVFKHLDDPKVAQWYLENKCSDEFNSKKNINLSGGVETKIVTDDDLKSLIEGIIQIDKLNEIEVSPEELIQQVREEERQSKDNE